MSSSHVVNAPGVVMSDGPHVQHNGDIDIHQIVDLFIREGLSSHSGGFVGAIAAGLAGSSLGIFPAMILALLGFILGRALGMWLDVRHHTLTH